MPSIFTPRGLQVRFNARESFSLIARVRSKCSAFRFLQLVEDFENYPSFVQLIVSVTCIALIRPEHFWILILAMPITRLVFTLIRNNGDWIVKPVFTFAIPFVRVYSVLCGRGLFIIPLSIWAYLKFGWTGLACYLFALIWGWGIEMELDSLLGKFSIEKYGRQLFSSELAFLQAYWYWADRCHISSQTFVSDEELDQGAWKESLCNFAQQYPSVVSRFILELEDYP